MPILDVELVLRPGESLPEGVAAVIADSAAQVFGGASGRTWVKIRGLPAGHYAEDGGGPLQGVHPVFVTVLQADPPQGVALAGEVARLTQAIALACDRSAENVHILYQTAARGRMAFGGRLV